MLNKTSAPTSQSSTFSISKDFGSIIKGLGIILMIIHHCFGFPNWFISAISYPDILPYAKHISSSTKICVSIFAFFTGWVYYFHRDKTFKYSLKKITNFLVCYWIDFLVIYVLAWSFCNYNPSIKQIFAELLPFHRFPLMIFAWYVIFYIWTMLALPICDRILKSENRVGAFFCCLSFIFIASLLNRNNYFEWLRIQYLYIWFPTVLAGYYFAKFHVFDMLQEKVSLLRPYLRFLLGVFIVICSLVLHAKNGFSVKINNGWYLAPMFIFGAYQIFHTFMKLNFVLIFLGKHAMNIWFLHCIFFSKITREVFQPLAYFPQNPIFVVILVLLVCSACSVVLTKFQGRLNAHVNRLIFDRK